MKITFWGVRGSIPTPGPSTVIYGGNTSCIELRNNNDDLLILDCGSGIRELGLALMKQKKTIKASILICHTHWDHIHGFPFFIPLYIPTNEFEIYGPHNLIHNKSLQEILSSQMDYQYFPVRTVELSSKINFYDIMEKEFETNNFKIKTRIMNHPVITLGSRISADGKTIVYTGDSEPYVDTIYAADDESEESKEAKAFADKENERLISFFKNADLLIMDAQYTDEEYKTKIGWGHSSLGTALEMAYKAEVKHLIVTHHEPTRTDKQLFQLEEKCKQIVKEKYNDKFKVCFAKEKMSIEI